MSPQLTADLLIAVILSRGLAQFEQYYSFLDTKISKDMYIPW